MPTDAPRRSSTGNRRGPPKPHVPFRGENFDVAKKTGVRVRRATIGSDGFEPFEDVVKQADTLTPYQVKGRKRKSMPQEDDDDDDDEEEEEEELEDMDIDSPLQYISHASARQSDPRTPKAGSSRSRPVSRTTNDVYDTIPSPHRSSPGQGRSLRKSAGQSRLSIIQTEEDYSMDMSMTTAGGVGGMDSDPPLPSPQNMSMAFDTTGDFDDDDDEDVREKTPVPVRKTQTQTPRGKGRDAVDNREEDMQVEDDIAQGLDDLGNDDLDDPWQDDEEPEPEPEPAPAPAPVRAKKIRVEEPQEMVAKKSKSSSKAQSMRMKENRMEGVRRSLRTSYKPLQYWRNEKVVYGRPSRQSEHILVPHIKEIIRIPEEPVEPLGKRRKRSTRSRSRALGGGTATPAPSDDPDDFPEKGWDDDTPERGLVIDWRTKELVEKRIACLAKNVIPQQANNSDWEFQKIFGDEQFIAAGQLIIPVGSRKPNKTTKDNTYVFCVLEGAVNVKINDLSMVLCQGAMFMVPRGNQYFIENISNRSAKLFFTQARMITDDREIVSPQKSTAKRALTAAVTSDASTGQSLRRAATMGA